VKIDWKKYPMLHRKCWDTQKGEEELKDYPKKDFSIGDSVQLLHEAIEFMFAYVDTMKLHDKDIFIVVGPSRTGKGTLLAALKGQKMKLFRRKAKDR
jgi:ABC-type ATPase with predicted acetyltransferase domain